MQQFDSLEVVSTLLQFIEREDFVVSASDYETILFLMFSKMGYFCYETEPEGEDWGETVVRDTDQTMSFAVNTIPLRNVFKTPNQNVQKVK